MSNVTLINVTQNISSKVAAWTVAKIYQLHSNKKFFYDRERLQRLLNEWPCYKKASYLTFLMNGGSCKDLFQIAEIKPIVESLRAKIDPLEKNYEMIKENLEYFEGLLNKGYEYIVLDGQHRINEIANYLEDKIDFSPISAIELKNPNESGSIFVKGFFSKLPDEAKDYIRQIPLVVTSYQTGDLRELAQIFITSNDMEPMTEHERRILNYNPLNRWLNKLCNTDPNIKHMMHTISGMTGEYDMTHKGDTLFVAEMLAYVNNNHYEGYNHSVLNDILGSRPSGKINITEFDKDMTAKIMRIMADGCATMETKHLTKFSRSSLYNLFYTISFLLQRNNRWSAAKKFDGKYSIKNASAFVKWFFDAEHKRMNSFGSYIHFTVPHTHKSKKQVHEWSFRKHNADQKHSTKQSFEGQGGSPYTFDDWARVRHLLADLEQSLTALENSDIIQKVGSRSGNITRDEALVAAGIALSESDDYEVNEIIAVSHGGIRDSDNVEVLRKNQNRVLSNRPNAKVVNG